MAAPIRIVHLHPRDMNIYGDHGNVLALVRRLEWHGYRAEVLEVNRGDPIPDRIDLIVGGGGQDAGQTRVEGDLKRLARDLTRAADDGTPMLVVCGMYQLFGHSFRTGGGQQLAGIGVLDVETVAGPQRLIGNVAAQSRDFGRIIGYENHSGRTVLGPGVEPFGRVGRAMGNNGSDGTEGARARHVIGTYLHGSLLPKNPAVADHLIAVALERRLGTAHLRQLDESLTEEARRVALSRPR